MDQGPAPAGWCLDETNLDEEIKDFTILSGVRHGRAFDIRVGAGGRQSEKTRDADGLAERFHEWPFRFWLVGQVSYLTSTHKHTSFQNGLDQGAIPSDLLFFSAPLPWWSMRLNRSQTS